MRWTRKGIIEEIRRLHAAGEELNYKAVEENHLNLVRAASWHFGTWKRAIEKSGLDYDDVSKYQKWSRERVVARIKELYDQGKDLSWRAISTEVDPPLAAAALRENSGFESWYEAITAAGLNHDEIARYRRWTKERVLQEILDRNKNGLPMSSIAVQRHNSPLYCAAKRRFLQWDNALRTAGLDPDKIRIRKAPEAAQPRRRRNATGQLSVPETAVPVSVVRPSSRRRNSDIPTMEQAVAMLHPESNGAPIAEKPRRGRKAVVPAEITAPIATAKVATNGTAPKGRAAKAAPPAPAPAPAATSRGRKAAAPAPVVEEKPAKTSRKAAPVAAPTPAPAKPARGKAAVAAPAALAAAPKGKKAPAAKAAPAPKAPAKAAKATAPAKVEAPAAKVIKAAAKPAATKVAAKAAPAAKATPAKAQATKAAPAPKAPAKAAAKAAVAPAAAPAKAAKVTPAKAAPAAKVPAKATKAAPAKTAKAAPAVAAAPVAPAKPARKSTKVEAPAPTPAPAKKAKTVKVLATAPVEEKKTKKEPKVEAKKAKEKEKPKAKKKK